MNDAWKGAKLFMDDPNNDCFFVTKAEYEEYGPDYFKEHRCSNIRVIKPEFNRTDYAGTENLSNFESKNNEYYQPSKKMKLN